MSTERKSISYDKKFLAETMHYGQIPLHQILSLDLKPLTQILLAQLFTHSDNWGVSFNQISKSFFHKKNRSDIKRCFEELKAKGFIIEKNDTYHIQLNVIHKHYLKFLSGEKEDNLHGVDSSAIVDKNTTMIDPLSGIDNSAIIPLGSSATSLPDRNANINYINNQNKELNQPINETIKNSVIEKRKFKQDLDLLLSLDTWFSQIYNSLKYNPQILDLETSYINHIFIQFKSIGELPEDFTTSEILFIGLVLEYIPFESEIYKNFQFQCNHYGKNDILKMINEKKD